ncbi:MAG TPA: SCO family protein [Rhodanobacteraceae bacterium]|nr:SCO family protein [Rhodanobacteraceae bacterium]
MSRRSAKRLWRVICVLALAFLANVGLAQTSHLRAPPDLLQRVGFDQNLGAPVPLDARFRDADGKNVSLQQLQHDKPTLLVPGYFDCRNICGVVRSGVANAVRRSGLKPGYEFNVVLVSIDPRETPADAHTAQSNDALAHPGAGVGHWHYLTGAQADIAPLMRAIGYRYFYDRRDGQYAHATGVVVLTPQDRVTQYLFGVQFAPETLRLALVDASRGKIGNIVDRLVLLCCAYDVSTGRYTLLIHRVMQGLGISSALALCGWLLVLRRGESKRARDQGAAP